MEEKERKALIDSITAKLLVEGGKIVKEELWGSRDLAYPLKRQTKGFYAHFEITSDPKNAKGLDKKIKTEEDILRYLLIKR